MASSALILALFQNAAFLAFGGVLLWAIGRRLDRWPWMREVAAGVIFGTTAVLVMAAPIRLGESMFFDARMAVVVLSAPVGGVLSGIIAAGMAIAMRLSMGGTVLFGVVTLAIGAVIGFTILAYLRRKGRTLSWRDLPLVGLMATAPLLPGMLVIPLDQAVLIVREIAVPLAITNLVGVVLIGTLVLKEGERQAALAALAKSEARLRTIADNLPGVVFERVNAPDGAPRYIYISSGIERLIGVSAQSGLRDPEQVFSRLNRQDLARYRLLQEDAARTMSSISFECRCLRPDDTEGWLKLSVSPRGGSPGEVIWYGLALDITDQKRLETAKAEAEAAKRSALSALAGEFEHGVGRALQILATSVGKMNVSAVNLTATAQDTVIHAAEAVEDAEITSAHVQALAEMTEELNATVAGFAKVAPRAAPDGGEPTELRVSARESEPALLEAVTRMETLIGSIRAIAARAQPAVEAAAEVTQADHQSKEGVGGREMRAPTDAEQRLSDVMSGIAELERIVFAVTHAAMSQHESVRRIHGQTVQAAQSTARVSSNLLEVASQAQQAGTAASSLMNAVTVLDEQTSALVDHVDKFVQHVKSA